jgi:hypothetical protein
VKKGGAVEMFGGEEEIFGDRKSLSFWLTGFLVPRVIRATKLLHGILLMNIQFLEESFSIFFFRIRFIGRGFDTEAGIAGVYKLRYILDNHDKS